jgi:mRNA interferase HigB
MRVIALRTLKEYAEEYHQAEQALLSWYDEAVKANWNNSAELKALYRNASILDSMRVVFNINGNTFRLIVDIDYKYKMIFIVWFGTHKQYDNIDAKTIKYVKTD